MRLGAAYFESQLADFDVASNWGNWAYIAGVGPIHEAAEFLISMTKPIAMILINHIEDVIDMTAPIIVWFKRDLRVNDHKALVSAVKEGPIIPLYVFEPEYWTNDFTSGDNGRSSRIRCCRWTFN